MTSIGERSGTVQGGEGTSPSSIPRRSGRGRLIVLSGPSGVGKTTVSDRLVARGSVVRSVSATTRPPRPGEVDGVQYRFVDVATFRRWIEEGAFLEWAKVHEHLYGTLRGPVEKALRRGDIVLLEIDVQGAAKLRSARVEAAYVFLAPPSFAILEKRLRGRGTEAESVVRGRLETARREMAARKDYDHVVENEDVDRAVTTIEALLGADPDPRCGGAETPPG